jgi:hypothetical protein
MRMLLITLMRIRIQLFTLMRIRIKLSKNNADPQASVLDPDPDSIRSVYPDLDPGEQKWHTKIEENLEISCFEVLDVLFES